MDIQKLGLHRLFESMADGVMIFGSKGKCLFHNSSSLKILGWTEKMLQDGIAEILSSNDSNDVFSDALIDVIYKKQKIVKTVPYLQGDDMLYIKVTSDLIISESTIDGVIVHISDVTDQTLLFIANKRLANQVLGLMHSFVETIITAIEENSPYNANHTKSMVGYARRYLEWLRDQEELGLYTQENTDPLLMSIWLHDMGKLLVPAEVLDKPTRLGNRLSDVLNRIETAQLMLRIRELEEPDDPAPKLLSAQLGDARELILSANSAGYLGDDTIEKLKEISQLPCLKADGEKIPLLNENELEMMTVVRGTLTAKEREIVQSHVSFTKKLLSKMEFRGEYKKVPLWAGSHHELLDGSGYPDKLSGDDIPWETRLLTIIDIYDALTAEDRPYKPPMPPEKAFDVLRDMSSNGKLDAQLLESFFKSGAWKK